jgi:hypothetical protein
MIEPGVKILGAEDAPQAGTARRVPAPGMKQFPVGHCHNKGLR